MGGPRRVLWGTAAQILIIGTLAAPPATIGRYELRERIAHGGMGVLYLAYDPVTEREVALKVLRVDSADLRDRFLREARLAARLQHPNIVTIYDVGAHEDQPFIAMEFIAGETLGQLVHRQAPLALSRRIALMEQVCVGLAYAHRHGIVHRDVKPANLMISRDSGVLKVLDFGVASRVDADPGAQGQMLMGTPNYMSPEQVVGQPADHRSDIFAVGLVLYELITYRQAFSGETQQSILLKVLNESPFPLADLVPGIDPALPAIAARALEKSVDRRYPDLEAMRSDLSRVGQRVLAAETSLDFVGRGTVAARGRGRAPRAGRFALRRETRRPTTAPPEPAAPAVPEPTAAMPHSAFQPAIEAPPAPARPPAARPAGIEDALAAAEREAYEGRLGAAVRRLEALGPHPEVDAALLHYRGMRASRDAAKAQGASGRAITDAIRAHVGGVREAIQAGRWGEAQELLRTLEREVPVSGESPDAGGPGGGTTAEDPAREAREMRRDDEVAHYLSRARRRLEAGDVTAAQSLLDAALDVTRTP
jgi:serine/threonine-protein kinase